MKNNYLFFLALFLVQLTYGQIEGTGKLHVIAFNTTDSVVIRWGIDAPAPWLTAVRTGFVVRRYEILQGPSGEQYAEGKLLTTIDGVRAQPEAEFKKRFETSGKNDPNLLIAAQAIYGKQFTIVGDQVYEADEASQALKTNQEQETRWIYGHLSADLSAATADALGMRWVDKQPPRKGIVIYEVSSIQPPGTFQPDTAKIIVIRANLDTIPSVPTLRAEGVEQAVRLEWDKPAATAGQPAFSAYIIEKKSGGGAWTPLHDLPILATSGRTGNTISSLDSVFVNYKPQQYRLIGITPFADRSAPGAVITAYGQDRTPPSAALNTTARNTKESWIEIKWEHNKPSTDMKGYWVEKSLDPESGFTPVHETLLPVSARSFIDKSPLLFAATHYRVVAVDTSGNIGPSYSCHAIIQDNIAPAPPTGLHGWIDSLGNARLAWKMGQEPDLFGYRVFFANQADHEMTNLTPEPLQDTVFYWQTTLKTLNELVYFKVVSVDRHFNHSGFSEMCTVARPDTIKPNAPGWKDWKIASDGASVKLEWIPAGSKDIVYQRLYRRQGGQKKTFEFLARLDAKASFYTDSKPLEGHSEYALEAIDDAGNSSGWRTPLSIYIQPKQVASSGIRAFMVAKDPETGKANLTWEYDVQETKTKFIIYKAIGSQPLEPIRTCSSEKRAWADQQVQPGQTVRYAIAVKEDGKSASALSAERSLTY